MRRVGLYAAGSLVALISVLAIAAVTPRQWGSASRNSDCRFQVYVSGGAMHTNLFVPVRSPVFDWNQHLDLNQIGKAPAATYRYLQFGWGDRVFYMQTPSWDQLNPLSALRSLILQNPAALFVKGHTGIPHYPDEVIKCISLSQADYLKLMQFLEATFAVDAQNHKQPIGRGQDGDSRFYAATGRYSALRTCNSWVADGLRAANVNTPIWGGLAPAVMHQLQDTCHCRSLE